jgi:hypothetical protein
MVVAKELVIRPRQNVDDGVADSDDLGGVFTHAFILFILEAIMARKRTQGQSRQPPDPLQNTVRALDDLDRAALDACGQGRDGLFEALMARFDRMQARRSAWLALLPSLLRRPDELARLAPGRIKAARALLEKSRLPASPVHALALCAAYAFAARTWAEDTSKDLGKTMAAVERGVEKVAALPCPAR